MVEYTVTIARSARKELEELPVAVADRVFARIEALARQPRPSGCVKLKGQQHLWRIRVSDYRIVYKLDDRTRTVDVSVVRHRRDVYRDY